MADFGPNSTAVARFLDRVRSLEEGDALALSAAWKAIDDRARRRTWQTVKEAARRAGRTAALEEAQAAIASWSNSWSPLTAPGPLEAQDDLRADVMRGAIPPLVDAVSAIVVDGLIDPEDAEALSGPWRAVEEGNRRT